MSLPREKRDSQTPSCDSCCCRTRNWPCEEKRKRPQKMLMKYMRGRKKDVNVASKKMKFQVRLEFYFEYGPKLPTARGGW